MCKKTITYGVLIFSSALAFSQDDLLACREVNDDQVRLACYDKVAGRVSEALQVTKEGNAEQRAKAREADIKAAVVGSYDVIAQEYEGFEVTGIQMGLDKRPIYVAGDGRSFAQVSGITPMLRIGERVEIQRGLFGSVFLVGDNGSRIKVKER